MRFSLAVRIASAAVLASTLPAQGANTKLLFNGGHPTGYSRPSATAIDTVYFVQPDYFRLGHGNVVGYTVTMEDKDQATAESCTMGVVKLTATNTPDTTATGLVGSASWNLFGAGSGPGSQTYTLTLASPITPPSTCALFVTLPAASATDGAAIHYQDGTAAKLPSWATKDQLTFSLDAQNAAQPWLAAGSMLRLGARYSAPTLGCYIRSTAYGPAEDLFGVEGSFPDSTRGDGFGFYFQATQAANQFAIIVLSGTKLAAPLPSPFGPFLVDPTTAIALPLPLLLDGTGYATTGTVPVPAITVTFWCQGASLNFTTSVVSTSDACRVQIQ
jgi:hypothetical protein